MTDKERLINLLYEFILYELSRCESDYRIAQSVYYSNKTQQNSFAVVESWVRLEYFRKVMYDIKELIDYTQIG